MDSISLAKQFQWILCKFDSEDDQASEKELENILNQSDKQINLLFSRIFFNFIPSRTTHFKTYASLFSKIPSLSSPEFKDIFLSYLRDYLLEPNQPEICEFFTFLVESKYIELDKAFEILLSLFQSAEKLQNIQFLQFLYCIFRIQNLLKTHPKYPDLMNEFNIRIENIKIGVNIDDNSEIFSYLYEQLLNPEKNPIKNIISDESEKIPSFESLDPSLYVSPSILSFAPPLSCVCAYYGALKTLKAVVSRGQNIKDDVDDEGRTLSQFASASGNVELLKYLKDTIKADFTNSLDYSIEYFRDDAFEYLISQFPLSPTAIHSACKANNVSKLEFLISKKVKLDSRDEYNWTPLHIAASHNSCEVTKILTSQSSVDINIADLDGETPLHCAAKDGYVDVIRILLEHPKIVADCRDKDGATPLHWAVINDQAEAVRTLISNQKVDVNSKDNFDRTPIILAALSNSPNALRVLLSATNKINANLADQRQTTPLIAAAEAKSVECARLLLGEAKRLNIELNRRNVEGVTALDTAAFADAPEIVELLLKTEGIDASDLNNQSARKQLSKRVLKLVDDYFSANKK
ncbi:hypothetical protein M9Y10_039157 [Tritrichomonas musculus]|uniref:Ankyrin repeat protein n=1 Tax=Tritrichomonas musculus TaxID=1915356 RepID=A0ABR2KBH3_9EUKA